MIYLTLPNSDILVKHWTDRVSSSKLTREKLIADEKANPQEVFCKTKKCGKCGHEEYELWIKVYEGVIEKDGG